jgi:hypothetical protein
MLLYNLTHHGCTTAREVVKKLMKNVIEAIILNGKF